MSETDGTGGNHRRATFLLESHEARLAASHQSRGFKKTEKDILLSLEDRLTVIENNINLILQKLNRKEDV